MTDKAPSLTWIGSDGAALPLTQKHAPTYSRWVAPGVAGLDSPPLVTWDRSATITNGGAWTGSRFGAREVFLPMVADAPTFQGRLDAKRELVSTFIRSGRPDEGSLRLTYADGSVRTLRRVRLVGTEWESDPGAIGVSVFGLTLRAYDPFLYGPSRSKTLSGATGDPFFPGPPFALAPDETAGTEEVEIVSEVPSWPKWSLGGPLTYFEATNGVETWAYGADIGPGERVTVDTDPSVPISQRAVNENGASVWGTLVASGDFPALFPLAPGRNVIGVTLVGATADTRVSYSWSPSFLTW